MSDHTGGSPTSNSDCLCSVTKLISSLTCHSIQALGNIRGTAATADTGQGDIFTDMLEKNPNKQINSCQIALIPLLILHHKDYFAVVLSRCFSRLNVRIQI